MMNLMTKVTQRKAANDYNEEAEQTLLRAMDGRGGSWKRHKPITNLSDIVSRGHANDNIKGE